jgi:hypothetical protein
LDSLGLVPTLSQDLRELADQAGISLQFDADTLSIPKPVETAVYRIVKEAVFAIVNSARLTTISVSIRNQEASLSITVDDDGSGWGIEDSDPRPAALQLALISIRKRAALLGGYVSTGSARGKGPRLRVTVPILSESSQTALSSGTKSQAPFGTADALLAKTTVLVVDDHIVARRGLLALLETDELVEVVGEAADGVEAVAAASATALALRPRSRALSMRRNGRRRLPGPRAA